MISISVGPLWPPWPPPLRSHCGWRRPRNQYTIPSEEQVAFEQPAGVVDVGLLRNYAVVERLDLLENYDVIEHLDQLKPASRPGDAARS